MEGHRGDSPGGVNPSLRVTIDVDRIRQNILAHEGGRLSSRDIRAWLAGVGFTPEPGGRTWLADSAALERLLPTEVIRVEDVTGRRAASPGGGGGAVEQ